MTLLKLSPPQAEHLLLDSENSTNKNFKRITIPELKLIYAENMHTP